MNRTIKKIKNSADRANSLMDQYRMYKFYRDGAFVEANTEQSEHYRALCLNNINDCAIFLEKIKLINFKAFQRLDLDISNKIVLIAAGNGYGKTGILEAIYLSLSWFFRLVHGSNQGWQFSDKYINARTSSTHMSIMLDISIRKGEEKLSTSRLEVNKMKASGHDKVNSNYSGFKELAEFFIEFREDVKPPLISFYSVDRGRTYTDAGISTTGDKNDNKNLIDVLYPSSSISGSANIFENFMRWSSDVLFKNIVLANDATSKQREKLNDFIAQIKLTEMPEELKKNIILEKQKEIESLKKSATQSTTALDKNEKAQQFITTLLDLGCSVLEGVSNIAFSYLPDQDIIDLVCVKNDYKISVSSLSHGEKVMLSLIFDIGYKLYAIHGADTPLAGKGIVLIDEIELHLHPSWQQIIISNLSGAFPGIQFIISTHSSNVLSTVDADSIRKIKFEDGGFYIEVPEFSRGAEAGQLQNDIQDVPQRAKNLTEVQRLEHFKELLKNNKFDSPEAIKLFQDILSWGYGHDPLVSKLKVDLELRKKRNAKK